MKVHSSRRGNIMLTAALLMGLVSGLVGITLMVSGTTTRNTQRSRNFAEANITADAALEYAYGIWMKRVNNKNDKLTTNEANAGLTGTNAPLPILNGFSSANGDIEVRIDALDEYGVPLTTGTAIPKGVVGKVPNYQGWSGQTFTYSAKAVVKIGEQKVGVRRLFQYTQVPLFQSMFFFEGDLELYRPAEMIIKGLIHSNSTIYMAGDEGSIRIQDYVSYVNAYDLVAPSGHKWSTPIPSAKPWFQGLSGWVKPSDSGYQDEVSRHVRQVARIEPMGTAPEIAFQDENSNNPNITGKFHELIEPPVSGYTDPPAVSERRLINKAGIIIEVNGDTFGTNPTFTGIYNSTRKATVYSSPDSPVSIVVPTRNGTSMTAAAAKAIAAGVTKTTANPQYTIVTGSTYSSSQRKWTIATGTISQSGIHDARESKWVDTVNVDLSTFKNVIQPTSGVSAVSSFNGVLYVHDLTPEKTVPGTSGTTTQKSINAIRLTNGSILPDTGLTIASQNPVYVQGDYNTGGTNTNVHSNNGENNKDNLAQPTTVNSGGNPTYTPKPASVIADAVMFLSGAWNDANSNKAVSGRVARNTTYNMAILAGYMPSTSSWYSGGANNFPRFLESWTNKYCTYWGSMVELFPSKTFTGDWNTTGIYDAPKRRWNFDTRFLTTPPPGSVDAIILSRGPWSRF